MIQLGWATEVGDPKTDSRARTVTLDGRSVAALRRRRVAQHSERELWGSAQQQTGLMFPPSACATCATRRPAWR